MTLSEIQSTISLKEEEKNLGLHDIISLAKEESKLRIIESEQQLRELLIKRMIWLFSIANLFVFVALSICYYFDIRMMYEDKMVAEERLISGQVIMTIVGATTVQLGTLIITAAGYLFPKKGKGG